VEPGRDPGTNGLRNEGRCARTWCKGIGDRGTGRWVALVGRPRSDGRMKWDLRDKGWCEALGDGPSSAGGCHATTCRFPFNQKQERGKRKAARGLYLSNVLTIRRARKGWGEKGRVGGKRPPRVRSSLGTNGTMPADGGVPGVAWAPSNTRTGQVFRSGEPDEKSPIRPEKSADKSREPQIDTGRCHRLKTLRRVVERREAIVETEIDESTVDGVGRVA